MNQVAVAAPAPVPQGNEILKVSEPFAVEVWSERAEAVEVTFRRQPGGPDEVALGMTTQALAVALAYANGSKGVRNVIRRSKERFARWTFQPSKLAGPQSEPSDDERLYVYGPGLDLVAVLSSQPRAADFQDWLAERSYELRTRGWAAATPEIEQAIATAAPPAPLVPAPGPVDHLALAEQMIAQAREQQRQQLALAAEQKALGDRQQTVEVKADQLEQRVARIEEAAGANQMQAGECSLTTLARRAGWWSWASGGTKPYGEAVLLAMLREGFHDRGLLRRVSTTVETGDHLKVVPRWVVTAAGIEEFFAEVDPAYPVGELWVKPNLAAQKVGRYSNAHVLKG